MPVSLQRRTTALLLLALGAVACSEVANGPGMISQRIGDVIHDPAATEVDLRKLTSFGWDRFVLFEPGTRREQICDFIGAKRPQCGRIVRYVSVPEDCVAIAFALDNQLTHIELHALSNGRFDLPARGAGHPRPASVFRIRRETSTRVWLEPK